jgi:hypothetical protein
VLEYSRCLAVVVSKPSSDSDTFLQSTNDRVDNQASTKYAKFLEECANSLREAFIRCLVGGSSGSAAHSTAPDGKRQGIYITSNSCLRLLGRCGKLRNATQMFVSIDAQSPYLDFYPRAQRVTVSFDYFSFISIDQIVSNSRCALVLWCPVKPPVDSASPST